MAYIDRTLFIRRLVAIVGLSLIIILAVFCGYLMGRKSHSGACKEAPVPTPASETRSWCIAKPGTSPDILQENIDYVCDYVDCKIIRQGGQCFYIEDKLVLASIVMNLYYKREGKNSWNCNFSGTGTITLTDPSSHGRCVFE